jgi:hypothetical protein
MHFLLAAQQQKEKPRLTLAFLLFFFSGSLALGLTLGWKALKLAWDKSRKA